MGLIFDLGFKARDLASSAIVGLDRSPEALLAQFAVIAVHGFGGVVLVVQPSGCGVDRARARHQLARRARSSVVGTKGEVSMFCHLGRAGSVQSWARAWLARSLSR